MFEFTRAYWSPETLINARKTRSAKKKAEMQALALEKEKRTAIVVDTELMEEQNDGNLIDKEMMDYSKDKQETNEDGRSDGMEDGQQDEEAATDEGHVEKDNELLIQTTDDAGTQEKNNPGQKTQKDAPEIGRMVPTITESPMEKRNLSQTDATPIHDNGQDTEEGEDPDKSPEVQYVSTTPRNVRTTGAFHSSAYVRSFEILSEQLATTVAGNSDQTAKHTQCERKLIRIFVSLKVTGRTGVKNDEFFSVAFNEFFHLVAEHEPNVKLIPWEVTDPADMTRAVKEITKEEGMWRPYFWDKRGTEEVLAGTGTKWCRIQISIPKDSDVYEIITKLRTLSSINWWEKYRQYVLVPACQAPEPEKIGWFFRSFEMTVTMEDLQNVLRILCKDHTLGLEWKKLEMDTKANSRIKRRTQRGGGRGFRGGRGGRGGRGQVYDPVIEGITIECDYYKVHSVARTIREMFSRRDYPLGKSFQYVPSLHMKGMKHPNKINGYKKMLYHQLKISDYVTDDSLQMKNIDVNLPEPHLISTRRILTELKVKTVGGCVGDNLFLSVDRVEDDYVCFVYHDSVASEASNVVDNLVLVFRDELKIDPYLVFDMGDVMEKQGWAWNVDLRIATNPDGVEETALQDFGDDDLLKKDEEFLAFMNGGQPPAAKQNKTPDNALSNLGDFGFLLYHRWNDNCDQTVIDGTNNTKENANALRLQSLTGKKKAIPSLPAHGPIKPMDIDATSQASNASSLTRGSGSTRESTRKRAADEARADEGAKKDNEWKHKMNELDTKHAEETAALQEQLEMMKQQILQANRENFEFALDASRATQDRTPRPEHEPGPGSEQGQGK